MCYVNMARNEIFSLLVAMLLFEIETLLLK